LAFKYIKAKEGKKDSKTEIQKKEPGAFLEEGRSEI